jgi:hypothetical protein
MRVVFASNWAAHDRRLRELLGPRGARIERVPDVSHLHLQLLSGPTTSLVVIDTKTRVHNEELTLTSDLRSRLVQRAQPDVVFLGPAPGHARSVAAFEVGVDNWITPTQSKTILAQHHFVKCVNMCREQGPRWSEGLTFLEDLPLHASGMVRISDDTLTAEVSVRHGRIGFVRFPELHTPFLDSVEAEVRSRCAEVDALRQTLGYPVYDWDRVLAEHACWGRARLRDALRRRWQQAIRWMAGTEITRVDWLPSETRFAEELAFEPFGLLSALDEAVPQSFARGRISFGSPRADNDMVVGH